MSKTRSNSKKIASRFMSIFFALCFALLCVPNLSVFAANTVTQEITWWANNCGGWITNECSSTPGTIPFISQTQGRTIQDPDKILSIKAQSNRNFTIAVKNNPTSRARVAYIYIYPYKNVLFANQRPVAKYVIKQDKKTLSVKFEKVAGAPASDNDSPIPFYPEFGNVCPKEIEFTVKSNCPFKPCSTDEVPASPEDYKITSTRVQQKTNGNIVTLSADSDDCYGTAQREVKTYTVYLGITRTYSKTKLYAEAEDSENKCYFVDEDDEEEEENQKINVYFTSKGEKISASTTIKMENTVTFKEDQGFWSSHVGRSAIWFKTAIPKKAMTNHETNMSPYYDSLREKDERGNYQYVNIPKPSNSDSWTICDKVDNKHLSRIPAFSESGPMFIYWDGYRHGFICSAVSFNEVFTDFQYLAEIDMKPSSGFNDTMHIYMLKSRGNGIQREYKLTGSFYEFDVG